MDDWLVGVDIDELAMNLVTLCAFYFTAIYFSGKFNLRRLAIALMYEVYPRYMLLLLHMYMYMTHNNTYFNLILTFHLFAYTLLDLFLKLYL